MPQPVLKRRPLLAWLSAATLPVQGARAQSAALQSWKLARHGISGGGAIISDAELVLGFAGRNLGMGARIDIRVDTECDPRRLAALPRHL